MASHGSLKNVPGADKLKFGLNVPVKAGKPAGNALAGPRNAPGSAQRPPPKALFGDDDDAAGGADAARANVNASLRRVQGHAAKLAEKEHEKALEEDPTAFDYDAVYDDMKKVEEKRKKGADDAQAEARKPRYIGNLLASAQERKAELLRVQERKIQREREEEKEKFGEIDSEKFVTSGYKKQMEEQRLIEEAERKREALEDVTKKKDLTDFYRNVLNTTTRSAPMPGELKRAAEGAEGGAKPDEEKAKAPKVGVRLNDAEEVVDKRDLLSAGLNVVKKPQPAARTADSDYRPSGPRADQGRGRNRREEETRRALAMLEAQRAETEAQERKRQQEEQEALAAKMARHNTEDTISDAKRRYLERKKQKEEEAAAAAAAAAADAPPA
ncbi:coiled-coil domain-containing protein 55-domain containing protein [Hyaloraphidium curvatum]|nr:coiled-coil domain-containing protein 55-domain containing protein [Hyaloraphidium curvatum]